MKKFCFFAVFLILLNGLFIVTPSVMSYCECFSDWDIEGNTVFIDDDRIYVSATPHTLSSTDDVVFEFRSKQFSGDIDLIWGFNQDYFKPKQIYLWKNYSHEYFYFDWVESYGYIDVYDVYNYTNLGINNYNNYSVIWGTENNNYLFEINSQYNESNQTCDISGVYAFSEYQNNGDYYTLGGNYLKRIKVYDNQTFFDWKKWDISYTVKKYDFQNMTHWYITESVNVEMNKTYKCKLNILQTKIDLERHYDKYWFCFKKSSDTLLEAIINNRFYALDPWYDTDWIYRKNVTITNNIDDYVSRLNVTKSSGGDVTCDNHCQDDFDDIRFAYESGTLLPYWIEYVDSGNYATFWFNNTQNATYFYLYYGNAGCGNVSNGIDTFDFFDDFNDASLNTTLWSTGGSGGYDESGGLLDIDGINGQRYTIYSDFDWHNSILRYKVKVKVNTNSDWSGYVKSGFYGNSVYRTDGFRQESGDTNFSCNSGNNIDYDTRFYIDVNLDTNFHTIQVNRSAISNSICTIDDDVSLTNAYYKSERRVIAFNDKGIATDSGIVLDWVFVTMYHATIPTFSFGAESPYSQDFTVSNIFPADSSYWCYDVMNLTEVSLQVNNTYGFNFDVNISFYIYQESYLNVGNNTYNLSLVNRIPYGVTNFSWTVNISGRSCVGNCTYNDTYVFDVCWDALIYIHLNNTNFTSGGDTIEWESTQFALIIQLVLFFGLMWLGLQLNRDNEMPNKNRSWHYVPFTAGLLYLFAAIDFIGMGFTLRTMVTPLFSEFIMAIGIVLLIYSVFKAFYYDAD